MDIRHSMGPGAVTPLRPSAMQAISARADRASGVRLVRPFEAPVPVSASLLPAASALLAVAPEAGQAQQGYAAARDVLKLE